MKSSPFVLAFWSKSLGLFIEAGQTQVFERLAQYHGGQNSTLVYEKLGNDAGQPPADDLSEAVGTKFFVLDNGLQDGNLVSYRHPFVEQIAEHQFGRPQKLRIAFKEIDQDGFVLLQSAEHSVGEIPVGKEPTGMFLKSLD